MVKYLFGLHDRVLGRIGNKEENFIWGEVSNWFFLENFSIENSSIAILLFL